MTMRRDENVQQCDDVDRIGRRSKRRRRGRPGFGGGGDECGGAANARADEGVVRDGAGEFQSVSERWWTLGREKGPDNSISSVPFAIRTRPSTAWHGPEFRHQQLSGNTLQGSLWSTTEEPSTSKSDTAAAAYDPTSWRAFATRVVVSNSSSYLMANAEFEGNRNLTVLVVLRPRYSTPCLPPSVHVHWQCPQVLLVRR